MPWRPAKSCGKPGCPNRVRPPYRYCPAHKSEHTTHRITPPQHFAIYDSAAWRHLSYQVLKEEPLCRAGCGRPSRDADHIVEIIDGGAPLDRANLQGLCRPCHLRKTALAARARATRTAASG
jgi:5-methylcytosine-specific restriction enzyme A